MTTLAQRLYPALSDTAAAIHAITLAAQTAREALCRNTDSVNNPAIDALYRIDENESLSLGDLWTIYGLARNETTCGAEDLVNQLKNRIDDTVGAIWEACEAARNDAEEALIENVYAAPGHALAQIERLAAEIR